MSESFGEELERPERKIEDAFNQILQFDILNDPFEEIKNSIKEADLKTLESYTGLDRGVLEGVRPGICAEYDALIHELRDQNLGENRFHELMGQAKALLKRI